MASPDVLRSKLGRRIVLLIILAGVLPLSLFAIPIHYETREIFMQETLPPLEGKARLAVEQIERTLQLAEARLRVIGARAGGTEEDLFPFRRVVRLDPAFRPAAGSTAPDWPSLDPSRQRLLVEGRAAATAPYASDAGVTIALIVPVDGGFAAGEIDPVYLWAATRGTNYGAFDTLWILDHDERVLASSAPYDPLAPIPGAARGGLLPRSAHATGMGELQGLASMAWSFNEIRSSLLPPGDRWGVLIARNATAERVFEEPLLKSLLLLFLLCLSILVLLSMRFARGIQGPITELADAARSLGDGDWSARATCANDDELGDLSRSFNRMAGDLKRTYDAQIHLEGEAVIGRLASQVAHEVNNPLAAIKTWIGHLRRKLPPEEYRIIAQLDAQLNRIARTVRSLLHFSKQRELTHAEIPATSLLEVIATLFAASFQAAGIRFETEIPQDLPIFAGDADQLQEVLINLLENSRAAVDSGGLVRLAARSLETIDGAFGSIEIVVENDGPDLGADPETLFRPFYTTKSSGTGLGLTLARRICVEHGGSLHGENREGGGARFVIILPCLPARPRVAPASLTGVA